MQSEAGLHYTHSNVGVKHVVATAPADWAVPKLDFMMQVPSWTVDCCLAGEYFVRFWTAKILHKNWSTSCYNIILAITAYFLLILILFSHLRLGLRSVLSLFVLGPKFCVWSLIECCISCSILSDSNNDIQRVQITNIVVFFLFNMPLVSFGLLLPCPRITFITLWWKLAHPKGMLARELLSS
jgi:hypothetical protein